jgi:hypothetical protein
MRLVLIWLFVFIGTSNSSELMGFREIVGGGKTELIIVNQKGQHVYQTHGDDILTYRIIHNKVFIQDRFNNLNIINENGVKLAFIQGVQKLSISTNTRVLGVLGNDRVARVFRLVENQYKLIDQLRNSSGVGVSDTHYIMRADFNGQLKIANAKTLKELDISGMMWNQSFQISNHFFIFKNKFGNTSIFNSYGYQVLGLNPWTTKTFLSNTFVAYTDQNNFTEIVQAKDMDIIASGYDYTNIHLSNGFAIYSWGNTYYTLEKAGGGNSILKANIKNFRLTDEVLVFEYQKPARLDVFVNSVFHPKRIFPVISFRTRNKSILNQVSFNQYLLKSLVSQNDFTVIGFRNEKFDHSDEWLIGYNTDTLRLRVFNAQGEKVKDIRRIQDFVLPSYSQDYLFHSY